MTSVQESLIDGFPEGLDQCMMRILARHVGRQHVIPRTKLLDAIHFSGYSSVDDRSMRALINALRKSGEMICSSGGINGGYWLAASYAELDEYISHELEPRAKDLLEQMHALKTSARERWNDGLQPRIRYGRYAAVIPRLTAVGEHSPVVCQGAGAARLPQRQGTTRRSLRRMWWRGSRRCRTTAWRPRRSTSAWLRCARSIAFAMIWTTR